MQVDFTHGVYRPRVAMMGENPGGLSTIASIGAGVGRAADAAYTQTLQLCAAAGIPDELAKGIAQKAAYAVLHNAIPTAQADIAAVQAQMAATAAQDQAMQNAQAKAQALAMASASAQGAILSNPNSASDMGTAATDGAGHSMLGLAALAVGAVLFLKGH